MFRCRNEHCTTSSAHAQALPGSARPTCSTCLARSEGRANHSEEQARFRMTAQPCSWNAHSFRLKSQELDLSRCTGDSHMRMQKRTSLHLAIFSQPPLPTSLHSTGLLEGFHGTFHLKQLQATLSRLHFSTHGLRKYRLHRGRLLLTEAETETICCTDDSCMSRKRLPRSYTQSVPFQTWMHWLHNVTHASGFAATSAVRVEGSAQFRFRRSRWTSSGTRL